MSAWFWLFGSLTLLLPRLLINDLIWKKSMIKNYFLVALRQIQKYKTFSAINVVGLALSMSVCLLILTLIGDLGSDDSFHPDSDRLYRLTSTEYSEYGNWKLATSSVK